MNLPRIAVTREQADAVRWWTDEQPTGHVTVTTTEQPAKVEWQDDDHGRQTKVNVPLSPGDEAEVGWWGGFTSAMGAEFHPVAVGTVVEVFEVAVDGNPLRWYVVLTDLRGPS